MDKHVAELLNQQVNKEFYSAYLYLSFADYFEERNLSGFGNWYTVQAQEERDHAMIIRNYLHANGEKIELDAIEKPDMNFAELVEPLEAALEHEKYVTSLINDIYTAAEAVRDYRTMQFLGWFIAEQCEEEENASSLVERVKFFGSDLKALYDLDKEYSARRYTPSSQLAK